jgi:thiol-disulfide isomerase/thioredoxin
MAYPDPKFPLRRRLFLGLATAFCAAPALADVGPALVKGSVAKFKLAAAAKPLPDFAFLNVQDQELKLSAWRGKTVLVNFWATWCAPCVKEMPSLDKLQAELGKERFAVLPLSLDGATRAKVAPFYEAAKLTTLGIWFDKGRKVQQALDVSLLPTSILIDGQGREIGRLEGEADWDTPEAIALMKAAAG